ncbi:MAG: response regulator [Roseiflexus sp.]|jgi:PAS domain S-box-containing protein/putative nucleotidyltransferase with HDIG domain|nr:response regulator [Roseiflexus sp.]MBO9334875.1 response regulator [Roseiflexus sp.]MBO9364298.1 response regulator [Roseiflexus sp.]MBO9382668.1 response regulator [Roseiflexus sp.]MBO9390616.1 response regulator [Roseiflexus sp.]
MEKTSTILIADDDPGARLILQRLLAREGHRVLMAQNGAEALRQSIEHTPDLVLLDVLMPELDGFEVCRQLRRHPRLREIPILLVTSLGDHQSRVQGLSVGADGFISKPFDMAELLAHVRTITRLNRYRRLLAEQERFQRLIELSPEGIATINAEGRLLLINPALAALLEAPSVEHLLGNTLHTYIHIASLDRYQAGMQALEQGVQQVPQIEVLLVGVNGRTLPAEISLGRFHDQNGSFAQIIIRDISERKRAEAQIHRQVSRLTSLHAIGVAITASLELSATLNILLDRLIEELRVDAASVLLLNPRTMNLEAACSRGLPSPIVQVPLCSEEGLAGMALRTQQTVSLTSVPAEMLLSERDRALAALFAAYFAIPLRARGEIKGVLEIMLRESFTPDDHWWTFLEALAMQAAIAIETSVLFEELRRTHAELQQSYDATIVGWSRALDLRDHETEGHSERVTELTLRLARWMGLPEDQMEHIRRGALLHDIGKMGVPDAILLKPGPLSVDEWAIMRQHPVYAFRWLSAIPFLQPALDIPYAHHERWDGSGYPRSLRGEQIPMAARIFAVVDVWDALRSDRPYRAAWTEEQAVAYLRSLAGTHFDPQVVRAFLEMFGYDRGD